jgi:hypothetical protein
VRAAHPSRPNGSIGAVAICLVFSASVYAISEKLRARKVNAPKHSPKSSRRRTVPTCTCVRVRAA